MKIAVTDTNIFIDLIKTNLLRKLFKIGVSIHTTEEVVNELLDHQKAVLAPFIENGDLTVSEHSTDDIKLIEGWPISPWTISGRCWVIFVRKESRRLPDIDERSTAAQHLPILQHRSTWYALANGFVS